MPRTEPSDAPPPVPPYRERWLRIAHASRFPLAVYGAALLLHLVMLAVMNPPDGPGVHDRLLSWDGQWFLDIARNGYPRDFSFTADGLTGGTLAFFPAYPFLVRVVHTLTGLDYEAAALVASHAALLAGLICVHRLLLRLYDRRTAGIATFLLACAQPMALVFFMAYSESLFLALAAGALLATHRKAWLTAGVLTLLAGLTRPVAVALIVALGVAVVLHLRRERRITWRPPTALLLSYCGIPAYVGWVGLRTGQSDAWFRIQEAGWSTRWDNGNAFTEFLVRTLSGGDGWVPVSTALLILALVAATVIAWSDDIWPPLVVYGTAVLITTLGQSNYYHSKLRLLIPALVFVIPVARALARVRARTAIITLAVVALFGSWYGAYMVTVWGYAI
ncbi:mannosyltransferase family protein [Streptomyces sp. NPDC002838]|uniref:mannosyltransferase family protein n=1 Tax=Streptomyces sp. NPDC002838 TaxID=3154436 RepID=UPI00331E72E4